jgi:hypothetical protein
MKYTRYMILLIALIGCKGAQAQVCFYQYSLNYATYSSESFDGTRIHTSVLTDGAASMSVHNTGCPDAVVTQMQNAINTATHYPSSYNKIGSIGGWGSGSSSCVSCYLSFENDQSVLDNGTVFSWAIGGEVICSVGGTVFNFGTITDYIEVAHTREASTGVQSSCHWLTGPLKIEDCNIASTPFCTAPTSPPDLHQTPTEWQVYPVPPPNFWDTVAIGVRFSTTGTWHFSRGVSSPYIVPIGQSPNPLNCTKHP